MCISVKMCLRDRSLCSWTSFQTLHTVSPCNFHREQEGTQQRRSHITSTTVISDVILPHYKRSRSLLLSFMLSVWRAMPHPILSSKIECRSCHKPFDGTSHTGNRGTLIMTCPGCYSKSLTKKLDKRVNAFQSLPTFEHFLESIGSLNDGSLYPLKWTMEFSYPGLPSGLQLKDAANGLVHSAYLTTGYRYT